MKIGHTGILWGIPADDIEKAYRETAELGYLSFETFGAIILDWNENKPGGWKSLVERYGIPTSAAYSAHQWLVAEQSEEALTAAKKEADALKELGGLTLVLQAGSRPEDGYTEDQFKELAERFHEIGEHCRKIGLYTAVHPHTGTGIETEEDIDTIMKLLEPKLVGFAPDTGQIAKGGSDIIKIMKRYSKRIEHVHLKDWGGDYEIDEEGNEIDKTGYANYEPIGNGVLPMPEILDILNKEDSFDGWINVELDGTPDAPRPPREAALMSRRYLGEVLGNKVEWKKEFE